jgi:AcrR family transcriptional regulator
VTSSTAVTPAPAATRTDRRRERTRAAIIEAATTLCAERGLRATSIQGICGAADIAERTFFNHFPTRDHLYEAIADHRIEGLTAAIDTVAGDPRSLAERLPDLFTTIGRTVAAQPAYRELVGAMLNTRPYGASPLSRSTPAATAVLALVGDGVERGEITARYRPEVLADLLLGSLLMAVANWSSDPTFDLERELADAAAALLVLFDPDPDPDPDRRSGRR